MIRYSFLCRKKLFVCSWPDILEICLSHFPNWTWLMRAEMWQSKVNGPSSMFCSSLWTFFRCPSPFQSPSLSSLSPAKEFALHIWRHGCWEVKVCEVMDGAGRLTYGISQWAGESGMYRFGGRSGGRGGTAYLRSRINANGLIGTLFIVSFSILRSLSFSLLHVSHQCFPPPPPYTLSPIGNPFLL